MKEYWVDFSASILVKANDTVEAREKFWQALVSLPGDILEYIEIQGIEENDK